MVSVKWMAWEDGSFDLAKKENRPVLLSIVASWCPWCRSMDSEVLSDPAVVEIVEKEYVPVRVDKDKRPDINERYNMGGWPSFAILDPEGEAITGGTYFTVYQFTALLEKVSTAYRERKEKIQEAIDSMVREEEEDQKERDAHAGELSQEIITNVSRAIISEFDEKYGGFGQGQKFPHPEAIDFTIQQYYKTNDLKLHGIINKTLQEMAEGALFDRVWGGFFRFCAMRDWRSPNTEKLLETNVGLLHNYALAYQVIDRDYYLDVARKTADYICTSLWDADYGAFRSSQDADDDYYQLDELARRDRNPPSSDRTIYANSNAMAASVFLEVSPILKDPLLKEMGLQAVEFVLNKLYSPERGVYHYYDGNRHIMGLLTDQIYLCRALLAAVEYAGCNRYINVIRNLLEIIIQKQSSTYGGFYDIPEIKGARGRLRRRNKSILENAVMAEVLTRFYYLTFEKRYLDLAQQTLSAFAHDYHLYGYFTAGYARAVDFYFQNPLYVVIVGPKNEEKTVEFQTKANSVFMASRLVLTIDPEEEKDMVSLMEFPLDREPTAYVCMEKTCLAAIIDPEQLRGAMLKNASSLRIR